MHSCARDASGERRLQAMLARRLGSRLLTTNLSSAEGSLLSDVHQTFVRFASKKQGERSPPPLPPAGPAGPAARFESPHAAVHEVSRHAQEAPPPTAATATPSTLA